MNKIHNEIVEEKQKLLNKKRRATIHENLLFESQFIKYNNYLYGISNNDEIQTRDTLKLNYIQNSLSNDTIM